MSEGMQALLLGILYWFADARIGYTLGWIFRQPINLAFFIGLIMGNMHDAIIIGASIELLYLGLVAPGANIPADEGLASCIAIPIALKTHMSPQAAVAFAVPLGVLGVFIDQIRRTVNAIFVHMADKYAAECNTRGIYLAATIYPLLVTLPLRVVPVTVAAVYGAGAVSAFMKSVPQWVIHAFEITGGVLPALGFALTMMIIGRRNLLPYFVGGFFLVKYAGMNIMAAAVFGTCMALIHIQLEKQETVEEASGDE